MDLTLKAVFECNTSCVAGSEPIERHSVLRQSPMASVFELNYRARKMRVSSAHQAVKDKFPRTPALRESNSVKSIGTLQIPMSPNYAKIVRYSQFSTC